MSLVNEEDKINDVIDISLAPIRKKRFRIDGDDSRILELNTSDLNILARLQSAYPKLDTLSKKAAKKLTEDVSEEDDIVNSKFPEALAEIDKDMRELVDYIFDSNVSEICAPNGTMYDPYNGQLKYEHIIDTLAKLYENNIDNEVRLIKQRVKKHTKKYTKK